MSQSAPSRVTFIFCKTGIVCLRVTLAESYRLLAGSPLTSLRRAWDLPQMKEDRLLQPCEDYWLYDVKFYPFQPTSSDQILAVILIYRLCSSKDGSLELIQRIEDGDVGVDWQSRDRHLNQWLPHILIQDKSEARNCCMAWTKDLVTGDPLICMAGENAKIKVIDARSGILRTTFIGHGGGINDLVISPVNPQILGSCSADDTIRLWSLDPIHKRRPCIALFAGEGHRATILSLAFHVTGQYLLSGGEDHRVNLWTVPFSKDVPASVRKPTVIYYPHFSTSQVHSNIVDCVTFHGDLILSKALHEDCIVLWLIKGFNSTHAPPPPTSAPTNYDTEPDTRSAFAPPPSASDKTRQYMRLLQFAIPDCSEFYMRFNLFSSHSAQAGRPVLAMCNSASKVFFWDLQRLEDFHSYVAASQDPRLDGSEPLPRPPWLPPSRAPSRTHDLDTAIDADATTLASAAAADLSPRQMRRYAIGDPFAVLEAHRTVDTKLTDWTGRQVAWSPCGRWCVVVGTPNVLVLLERGGRRRGRVTESEKETEKQTGKRGARAG